MEKEKLENQTKKLYLNPLKEGATHMNKDPFRSKKIVVRNGYRVIIDKFDYTPCITLKDVRLVARKFRYNVVQYKIFCSYVNEIYCCKITGFFNNNLDLFQIPKGMKLINVKKRILNKTATLLNLYETNKIENDLWKFFTDKIYNDANCDIDQQIENAAKMEFNRLKRLYKQKKSDESNLRQQMLLLKHFGFIALLDDHVSTLDKKAFLVAKMLNNNVQNVKHYLTVIESLDFCIKSPADYRQKIKLSKFKAEHNIYTHKNLDFLNKILLKLGFDKV